MNSEQSCSKCIFFQRTTDVTNLAEGGRKGKCRRFPPSLSLVAVPTTTGQIGIQGMSDYPTVQHNDVGCGEFKTKEEG